MATIRKRTSKQGVVSYQVQVRRSGETPLSKTFKTEQEALAWIKETEEGGSSENETVASLITRYLKARVHIKPDNDPRTAKSVENTLEAIKKQKWALKPIKEVTPKDLKLYKASELERVKPSTYKRNIELLMSVFSYFNETEDLIVDTRIYSKTLKRIKKIDRERRLKAGEYESIVSGIKGREGRKCYKFGVTISLALFHVAMYTALRVREIVYTEWQDLDLEKGLQVVRREVSKTKIKDMTIPLSPEAIQAYESMRPLTGSETRVFATVTPPGVTNWFARVTKEAGIKDLTFHDLRHEATSGAFDRGLTINDVKTLTRHKTLSKLSLYTHIVAEDVAKKLRGT